MSSEVLVVVLLSALLHAGWNAMVRGSGDKLMASLLVAGGAAALALPLVPWLPLPAAASLPFLLASAVVHVAYFLLVARAYRDADLGLAYPLMRGTAPLLTAVAAAVWLGEVPVASASAGIAMICGGVLALAGAAWRHARRQAGAVAAALANAAVIALYTVIDGQGVRLAGHALAYSAWLFVLTALLLLGTTLLWRGPRRLRAPAGAARIVLLGGAGTLGAYSLVLWAMTRAPIAGVAALRETSIVFAALIGALLLHEPLGRWRLLAVVMVCAGAAALRLA